MLHTNYLHQAESAMRRGDLLTAWQYGVRAAGAPADQRLLRCDAQMLLATVAIKLGAPTEALACAVGATFSALYAGDHAREERASHLVAALHPGPSPQMDHTSH